MVLTAAIVTSTVGAGIGGLAGTAAAKSTFKDSEMDFCKNPVQNRVDADGDGYLSSFEICINADTMIQDGTIGSKDIPKDHAWNIKEGNPKFAYFGIIEKGGKKRPILLGIEEVQSGTVAAVKMPKEIAINNQADKRDIYLDNHDLKSIRVMYVESDSSANALVLKDVDTLKAVGAGVKGGAKVIAGTVMIVSGAVPAGITTIGSATGDGVTVAKSVKKSWGSDDHIDTDAYVLANSIRLEHPDNDKTGQVTVTSNVNNAEVLINGQKVGTTPYSAQYPVDAGDRGGQRTITVKKDGYVTKSRTVNLSPPQTLDFDLQKVTKPINVVSAQDGRTVRIDGQYVGTTPWNGQRWVKGSYDITVENVRMENGTTGDRTYTDVTPPASINASAVSSSSGSGGQYGDLIPGGNYYPGEFYTGPNIGPQLQFALPPSAEFVASPKTTSVGQPVTFDASNSFALGNATYEWQFGDGTVESGSSPVANHTYGSAGTYSVNLTVTDSGGATASLEKTVKIENAAPKAGLVASTQQALTGESVRFAAGPSTDPEGSLVAYEWDFDGDGTTDATGRSASHAFPNPGDYTVELTVTDSAGNTDSASRKLSVSRPNTPPQAQFTVQQSGGRTVNLDASGSMDPDGSIRSYTWEFGDGKRSNGQTVSHSYSSDGTYQIRLLVTDDRGDMRTVNKTVTVTSGQSQSGTPTPNSQSTPADGSPDADGSSTDATPAEERTPANVTPTPDSQSTPADGSSDADGSSTDATPAEERTVTTATATEAPGGDGPGFGIGVALLALLGAVLLAVRRLN